MAARKRTALGGVEGDVPPEALAPRTAVRDPEALSDDVERVLAELGEGASTVAIYREDDTRPGKFDFVVRVPAPEFSNDYVATQYGGGNYKIIVTDANQGPLNPVFFSVDRRIVGKAFAITGTNTNQQQADTFKDRLLEILLARALTPAPAPVVPQSNAGETVQLIAALAPLLRQNGDGGGFSMEGMAAMLGAFTDLASKMTPPEGLAGVAAGLLPAVEKLVTAQAALSAQRRVNPPAPPRVSLPPAPRAPSAETSAQPVTEPVTAAAPKPEAPVVVGAIVPEWLKPFQAFAGILVNLADTDADPNVYADVCVDQLTGNESAFRSACEAMQAGTLKDDVLSAVPALNETEQRQTFVTELVTRVEEGLREVLASAAEESANG